MILVVIAGCSGSPPAISEAVTVAESIDRDCDGYYQSFELNTDVLIGIESAASDDAWVELSYRTEGTEFTKLRTFDDLSGWDFERNVELTASDFGGDRTIVKLRVVGKRSTFLGSKTVSKGTTEPIKVEPAKDDASRLQPTFTQEPAKPNRTEPLTLTATTGDGQCPITAYEWDVDGDGVYEQRAREVELSYPTDGRHDVTLRVTDSIGNTAEVTEQVLVFHDPDSDGITTAREQRLGTDPQDWDTDDDLFGDKVDPAPNTLFLPTGGIHIVLIGILYLGAFWYRDRIHRWSAKRINRIARSSGRLLSQIQNPRGGGALNSRLQKLLQNSVNRVGMYGRQLRSRLKNGFNLIKQWIDNYM